MGSEMCIRDRWWTATGKQMGLSGRGGTPIATSKQKNRYVSIADHTFWLGTAVHNIWGRGAATRVWGLNELKKMTTFTGKYFPKAIKEGHERLCSF